MATAEQKRAKRAALAAQRKAAERAREAAEADRLEREAEALAPLAQRRRRVVRDGISFRVGSPVARIYAAGQKRAAGGLEPTLGLPHVKAADRLMRAWEASQTITVGVSSYGMAGIGGAAHSGVMSQTVINSVHAQHQAAESVFRAKIALNTLWGIIEAVVLSGCSLEQWARHSGFQPVVAGGYLRAGLDLLAEHHRREDNR